MSPTSRRLLRLQHECDVSPMPCLLLAVACASLCIWLLTQGEGKVPLTDRLVQESASRRAAPNATVSDTGGNFDVARMADGQPHAGPEHRVSRRGID